MAFTSLNTTVISCGAVKLILRLTFQGLKPNRANHVLIYSSVQTVLMIKRNEARVSTGVVKLMAKAWPELADDQQGRRIFS